MRNKPLPGLCKSSPLHTEVKPLNAKGQEQGMPASNPQMGYSQSMKKLKRTGKKRLSMQDPSSGGFMHPPYKVQRDLAGNVKYYHGFKKGK